MGISKDKGFTLLEALISLGILVLIVSTLPLLLTPLQHEANAEAVSIRQGLYFISLEIYKGNNIKAADGKLYVQNQQGQTAVFEKYKNMIRRQVNGKGHEVYLHRIQDWKVIQYGDTIVITIKANKDELYEKRLSIQ
ncbi:competence protein ComGF [Terribacillus aidingensis]|uniref:Competence protein ComGF n=1 Tax=Terribacillus aidingensis TaxID=586416 RepID=A0A285NMX6_9BACI|nr:competence type IV pilus minor pilin ComGF [Terribacillus aidingensis]SNZ10805.1 competence protein ComGF [Terribacillus aidingensis]